MHRFENHVTVKVLYSITMQLHSIIYLDPVTRADAREAHFGRQSRLAWKNTLNIVCKLTFRLQTDIAGFNGTLSISMPFLYDRLIVNPWQAINLQEILF